MFRSLRVRNYRLYASGQLVSLTGNWMQRVAQDWLVLELTNSGTALGVVTALQFLPSLFSPWGGVIADRYDKRKILLVTQSSLALLALALGLLDLAGVVRYWHVLVLALLLGLVNVVDSPTRQAFVVEMVGRKDLPNAVAINSTTFNAARIMGPAIAGGTIAGIGTSWAFVANAASSLAVLAGLWLMRPSELHPSPPVRRARGQLMEGLRYVRRRGDLVVVMILIFVISTFGMNFQITTALLAKQVFHRGAAGYGMLSTALAVGACLGAIMATRRSSRPTQLFLVGVALAFSAVEVLAGLLPSYLMTALLLVPTGWMMLTMTTAANSFTQLGVEPTMQGRVMALYVLCFLGGAPLGAPAVGWIAGVFGPRWSLIGGGLIGVITTVVLALVVAHRRQLPPAYFGRRARLATQFAHAV
jgi:MFS family permease